VEYESVRRTPRYSLALEIEMTDVKWDTQIRARTKMLSLFGCGIDSERLFSRGTSVRIKLFHHGAEVKAGARVVYSTSGLGMGVAFTSIEREDEQLLARWITELLGFAIPRQ
jgi:hypothetical protein